MSRPNNRRRKLAALYQVARYKPIYSAGLVTLSVFAALLEGIGLSFILPIIEHARGAASTNPGGIMEIFISVYEFLGVPFTLEFIVVGVGLVMILRYTLSFVVAWLRVSLQTRYMRHLRTKSFERALDAQIRYFDQQGSDDILNAIITQTGYASGVIERLIKLLEVGLVSFMYFAIALYISPLLTLLAGLVLVISTVITRTAFESGFSVGDRVAKANERIQKSVQAGTQGIRDVKLFNLGPEIFKDFERSLGQFVDSNIQEGRNTAGINNFHQLIAAMSVFLLIYLGLEFASLTIGSLGVFLFAMYRLAPRISTLNKTFYRAESDLPHLIRAQDFIEELAAQTEESGDKPAPESIESLEFNDVSFSYDDSETLLEDISFVVENGEFVAFVGESGAGKSTIVALLAQMYQPDSGTIYANDLPIEEFELESWRERIAVVRQNPYIFDDTLRFNISIGNRDAGRKDIEKVSEIAKVDEFVYDLPQGFDSLVGDDGVRLSGGQKQRVALARALLKDAEILVLDEATSNLDTNIESEVQRGIESVNQDYITITVAHRLSTVKNADRIYTIKQGRIIDFGDHQELIDRDGEYAELYSR